MILSEKGCIYVEHRKTHKVCNKPISKGVFKDVCEELGFQRVPR